MVRPRQVQFRVALAVRGALARRAETSWVDVTSGGTAIVCVVRAPSLSDSELLLTLPQVPRVPGVSAQRLLHLFHDGPARSREALSAEQAAACGRRLGCAAPDASCSTTPTAGLSRCCTVTGRTGLMGLAGASGHPPTTLRRRLARLRSRGAPYLDVDLADASLGQMQSRLWLSVAPDRLRAGPCRPRDRQGRGGFAGAAPDPVHGRSRHAVASL